MSISRFVAFVLVFMAGTMLPFLTGDRPAAVHAQSSTWEVIAQPETVANVTISVIRHTVTHHCLVVVQSGSSLALHQDAGLGGLCDTSEEYEERKSKWEHVVVDDIPAPFRMFDERVQSSAQPSAGQTTKQPGVPR
jgi:hypothetical protein